MQHERSDANPKSFLAVFQAGFDSEAAVELRGAVAKSNTRAIRIANESEDF
jgi:hypothetical protein